MAFYHPKTGSEVEISKDYVKVLTGTAQEVRKILDGTMERPIMPESVKNLYDLLEQIILNPSIPVNQILEYRQDNTTRDLAPQTFEGMWTIAFALGAVNGYENITMMDGQVEKKLTPVNRVDVLTTLLEKTPLKTSSRSGASDISFSIGKVEDPQQGCIPVEDTSRKATRDFVFCTSKYFKRDDTKSVDSYDIANIMSAAKASGYGEDEYRILVLANNKSAAKTVFDNARRRFMTKPVTRGEILGREDLEAAFIRLRERIGISENPIKFIQDTFLGEKPPQPFLSLRFHQELVVEKTLAIKKSGKKNTVLWGVVARGGKTYICGGLIRAMNPKCVFIVAGAYTETRGQFLEDLLVTTKGGFQDFAEYTVVDVKGQGGTFDFDSKKKYIFFISAELLKLTGTTAKKRDVLSLVQSKTIVPELVFFDEIHKGGTTQLADSAMTLIGESAFKVFMTATYVKPFIKPEYNIDSENLITWGYEDIQMAKTISSEETMKYFETKYGQDLCRYVINLQRNRGITLEDIELQYRRFPEIQFLTTMFSQNFEESMTRQNILDQKTGFSMRALLATTKDCSKMSFKTRYKCLKNPSTIGLFLNYIGPANEQMTTLDGMKVPTLDSAEEHITNRIGRNSQMVGDYLSNIHTEFKPHSQLWFLPQPISDGSETPLISMMTALASLLIKHPWFSKHFSIVVVASSFKDEEDFIYDNGKGFVGFTNGGDNTKQTILTYERRAYEMKQGLIIIAGKMLTLGISLPCVNVVGLLDDSESSDLTYQKMFRALTENEGKKLGYIIDVNPLRTLKTLYDYTTIEKSETNPTGKEEVDAVTLTNLYLVDQDQMFVINKDGSRLTSDKLHTKINEMLQSSRKIYRSIIEEAASKLMTISLDEEVAALRDVLNPSNPQALQIAIELSNAASAPSGIETLIVDESKKKEKKVDNQKQLLQSLREMILTSLVMMAYLSTATTFDEALVKYQMNTDGLKDAIFRAFVDRGLIKEDSKQEEINKIFEPAIIKATPQVMHPYFKMRQKFSNPDNDYKEVLEFIEDNLKPKKEQVASRGEVFTPTSLVEEMLKHLPEEMLSHPEYKWLDPANGIGNFPVIAFILLDKHLRNVPGYENDNIRRRHIVENMLYMVELDPTNVMLSKKLLQKMCGTTNCKLNILQADFLTADIPASFGVSKFHVVMGNPPYNPPKTETGSSGNSIWQNFVMKSESLLAPNGCICFVHPPGWKKPTEDVYKPSRFVSGNYKGQIRQGQVWQYLKTKGSFTYIYTNDQRNKNVEYFPNFPAIDYYVFQKDRSATCDTRNVFYGKEYNSTSIDILNEFPYLPCLITTETMQILKHLISKEGTKLKFKAGFDPRGFKTREKGSIQYLYEANAKGPVYQSFSESHETVTMSKVVMNYIGGINGYYVKYVDASENIGVLHHSMFVPTSSAEQGKHIESFFKTDIVKFIFLITQYAFGQRTLNEHLVANSLTIPPIGTTDYYKFFGIEEYRPFIEKVLADSLKGKPQGGNTTPRRKRSPNITLRNSPKN